LPLEVTQKEPKAGALIASQYLLERELGSGGMGVVWAAERVADHTKVALKFLRGDRPQSERVRQRFLQEARATRTINHPGVVQIHDVVEEDGGLPVLVMDLLIGETLASRLERDGPMHAHDAVTLLLPAAEAVAAAHDQRIIHRDLKPENLFLCAREGEAPDVRVLDFGIAKVMRDDADSARSGVMTSTGVVLGTPFYMAPEQLFSEGQIDERSDVWAFGVILYESIAGRRPFAGPSVGQVLRLIALDEYTPLDHAAANKPPASVCDLVARLLSRDRAERPRTMREVEGLLRQILDGTYVVMRPSGSTQRSPAAQTVETISDPRQRASTPGAVAPLWTPTESAGVRTDAGVRTRRIRALGLGIGGGVVLAVAGAGAVWLRTPGPSAATVANGASRAASTAVETSPSAAPPASAARLVAPSDSASAATPPPLAAVPVHPADAKPVKPVAARQPQAHPAMAADASAPAPSATPSVESARRPGSVVDQPPF
jgi:serine/threonine-protein kinase